RRLSADGKTFAVAGWDSKRCTMYVFEVPERRLRKAIELTPKSLIYAVAFSPDSRWLAVVTRNLPEDAKRDPSPEEMPQPRIHLIDSVTGEIRETLIAPQALPQSACFSPDGKTLATGGRGKVHLWDVSDLK